MFLLRHFLWFIDVYGVDLKIDIVDYVNSKKKKNNNKKQIIERSRVCHNHKQQPTLDTKGRDKGQKHTRAKKKQKKTNKKKKQMYEKHKDQLPLP